MERITTAEAAKRLGLSMSGVRRRIKAGQLAAEWEHRPQGTRLRVLWDAHTHAHSDAQAGAAVGVPHANTHTNGTHTDADKDALIAWLQRQLEESQQGQAELRRMLNLEQQTVAGLRDTLAATRALSTPTPAHSTPTGTPTAAERRDHRPWWRRWLRSLTGA